MLTNISNDVFADLVRQSNSYQDLAKRCGCPVYRKKGVVLGPLMRYIQQKIKNMQLDIQHFDSSSHTNCPVPDDVFMQIVKDSTCLTHVMKKCIAIRGKYTWDLKYCNKRIQDLCINTDHFKIRKKMTYIRPSKILNAIDDEKFQTILQNSRTWSDLSVNCGYKHSVSGSVAKLIHDRIHRLGLNTKHFESRTVVHDNFFRKGNRYTNGDEVKKYLVKKLGWRYECNECKNVHFVEQDGVLTWMNKPVVLQLDHINGDHNDNRLDNLRFLCSLCHSQTSTFCGRNNPKYKALQKWLEDGKIQQCEGQMIKKPSPQHTATGA
jgi:hypothetical protein